MQFDETALMARKDSSINRLWRLIMTGFCFTLFGVGGFLLSLIGFTGLRILQSNPVRRRQSARKAISISFRCFLWIMHRLGVLDYRIEGVEKLNQARGCLIVANHPTLIDYVLIASAMPQLDCLVKAELLTNPFLRGVVRSADYLVNSQAEILLPESQSRLDSGDNILIFPEGTRTQPGKPLVLQRGAANIAVRCRCDLYVLHVCCSQNTLSKHSKWYHIPPQKPLFTVELKQYIEIDTFIADKLGGEAIAARHLTRYLTQALAPESGALLGKK